MSSPNVNTNVIVVPVVKTKKPRAPKTVATVETVSETVSESVTTELNTDNVKDKKTKKPRAPKTVVSEPVVAVTELVAEPTTEPVVTEKKKREPGLPAKFGKFLQFGVYLAETLKDSEGNITINSYDDFINKICIFDTVDNQTSFVQKFFDQSKDINKSIKKMVLNKKKADVKAAKLAAKPTKNNMKKTKKTSNNTDTDTDNFVSEVVSLANPKPKRKYKNKKIKNLVVDCHQKAKKEKN